VDGGGTLNERIERVLRNDQGRSMTRSRKVLISSAVALFIIVAVACRNQSVSLPALGDLTVEEPRATARENAQIANNREVFDRWRAQEEAIKEAQTMDSAEAAQLEAQLVRNPEDMDAQKKLVYYYARDSRSKLPPEDVAARRRHILWLIEHHPES